MSTESATPAVLLVRQEDADHPKLERVRRAVEVTVGGESDVSHPWLVWASGITKSWLSGKLEKGGQVVIFPPWPEGGFAGLPATRIAPVPTTRLVLDDMAYSVGASSGIEPSPAWREYGVFSGSNVAWLVAHEPFAGAGQAWLCTAELLISSPTTRPREARKLLADLVNYLDEFCRKKQPVAARSEIESEKVAIPFNEDEVTYLLAILATDAGQDVGQVCEFLGARLGVNADPEHVANLLARPDVAAEAARPVGYRTELAKWIDGLGFQSYRQEIEETRR